MAEELKAIKLPRSEKADVALVSDYEAAWICEIQPHGEGINYLKLVFQFYTALRQLGLDVNVLPTDAPLDRYRLIGMPSLPIVSKEALKSFSICSGIVVLGPRSGSKTETFQIPGDLPPGLLQKLLPIKVVRVESLGHESTESISWNGKEYRVNLWKEWIETELDSEATWTDGGPAMVRHDNYYYLAFWPPKEFLVDLFGYLATRVGLKSVHLPDNLRLRKRGNLTFAINYASYPQEAPAPPEARFIIGGQEILPHDVAIWKEG